MGKRLGGLLLLIGAILGWQLRSSRSGEESDSRSSPTEAEIVVDLEKQEHEYISDWNEIAQNALEGNIEATQKMFDRYTYVDRDYERSYFWGMLCERQGIDVKFGKFVEIAEGNIKAHFWSETRDPNRGKGSMAKELESLLPQ